MNIQKFHEHFLKGEFSVKLGGNNPFGRIPMDQTIEETANRDTKNCRWEFVSTVLNLGQLVDSSLQRKHRSIFSTSFTGCVRLYI